MTRFKHRFGYTLRRTRSGVRRWIRDARGPAVAPAPPMSRAERLEKETLAQQWNRRIEEGLDPLTGRDHLGFDEFGVDEGGFRRDGTSAFGYRLYHERTKLLWDERGFDWCGIHRATGRDRTPFGYDRWGFSHPEDGSMGSGYPVSTRLHALTGTPFAPPPKSRDFEGRDRLGRDKAGERREDWPDPYYR